MRALRTIPGKVVRRLAGSRIPFALTVPHYYPTGPAELDLRCADAWDQLRTSHPHFVIPDTREEWLAGLQEEKDGQDAQTANRATALARDFRKQGIARVHSVGAGGGALEFHLKQAWPQLHLTASDFNPLGVSRLRSVFTECDEIIQFDFLRDNWPDMPDCALLYRVDPHFSNEQWRSVFERMHAAKIGRALFIPSHTITFDYVARLKHRIWRDRRNAVPLTFTGYVRSASVFPLMWRGLYDHTESDLVGMRTYCLKARSIRAAPTA